ncbi:hypothetical protein C8R47DRAFT_1225489 [Mycena vitilis]|nr:hypothetical protein C8R47DRAFT_1225489 [Mycena vitilis]
MGGGPRPISSQKPCGSKNTSKRIIKSFIDDEAIDSDDGLLVGHSGPDGSEAELNRYEEEFINDGDPFAEQTDESDASKDREDSEDSSSPVAPTPSKATIHNSVPNKTQQEDSDDSTFPATLSLPPRTPLGKRPAKTAKKSPVIELTSSSEEDLTAMDVDDSMYKKPAGVKPIALPPALATRSATAKHAATARIPESPPKKKGSSALVARTIPEPVPATTGGFGSQAEMMQFMSQFMTQYLASKGAPPLPDDPPAAPVATRTPKGSAAVRVDFDAIELHKAIKASKREANIKEISKRSTNGAGSSKRKEPSPEWDPPYDDAEEEPVPKGKGKAKAVARSSRGSKSVDLITRVQGGEDLRDAPPPDTPAVVPVVPAATPLTLQQYFALHGSVAATADAIAEAPGATDVDSADHSTVFMEQLETYKAYYDAFAICGVNDEDLQDPVLVNTYIGQPPLPADRFLLPVYDPERLSGRDTEPVKGGRVKFSTWAKYLPSILADNAIGAVLFREADPNFINPSRVSPLRLSSQVSAGSAATQRLMVDGRVAMCVTPIFCTESFLVDAKKIGAKTDRTRKWISGIPHNQEYERMEALLCLVLGEPVLYAQITPKKAMSFQTMMSPANEATVQESSSAFTSAPSDMFSPVVASKSPAKKSPAKKWNFTSKTLLASHDIGKYVWIYLCPFVLPFPTVPVYDARGVVFDFNSDLARLDTVLPAFHGEVPFGSFVVVGYTVAGYKASLSAGGERVPHMGCNILWAVVCGTPPIKDKR